MSCGQINFLEGGTLKDVTLLNGSATGLTMQGGSIDSSGITNLTFIDERSVQALADALGSLPPPYLAKLAHALEQALRCESCKPVPPPPAPIVLVGDSGVDEDDPDDLPCDETGDDAGDDDE